MSTQQPPGYPSPKDELPPPYEPGPNPPQARPLPGALGAFQALVGAHASPTSLVSKGVLGIYHVQRSDLYIARSATDNQPIYYIGTHGTFSSQPDVTIHLGSSPDGPTIATADFPSFSSSININLFENGKQTGGITVTKSGWINQTWGFAVHLPPPTNLVETFEWRDTGSDAVQRLGGAKFGMECVSGRGELVAVFAGTAGVSVKKFGQVVFLPKRDGRDWGEGVEGLVLTTLIGLKERQRRNRRNNS